MFIRTKPIIIWFLSFNLLMWCVTLIGLQILKNPCIPGIKPTWSWCMIFFNMLLDSVCQNFVKDFASMFISDIGLQFCFFVAPLSGFGIRVMVASQDEFGSLPSSAIFWKSLSGIGVSSSLNFGQNSAVKTSGPGLLFVGRFLISVCISVLVMELLTFSISSWFSFGKFYFSTNLSISSKLSILLAYSCDNSLL